MREPDRISAYRLWPIEDIVAQEADLAAALVRPLPNQSAGRRVHVSRTTGEVVLIDERLLAADQRTAVRIDAKDARIAAAQLLRDFADSITNANRKRGSRDRLAPILPSRLGQPDVFAIVRPGVSEPSYWVCRYPVLLPIDGQIGEAAVDLASVEIHLQDAKSVVSLRIAWRPWRVRESVETIPAPQPAQGDPSPEVRYALPSSPSPGVWLAPYHNVVYQDGTVLRWPASRYSLLIDVRLMSQPSGGALVHAVALHHPEEAGRLEFSWVLWDMRTGIKGFRRPWQTKPVSRLLGDRSMLSSDVWQRLDPGVYEINVLAASPRSGIGARAARVVAAGPWFSAAQPPVA